MSTLKDLNKHLFAQLDRLAVSNSEQLEIEIDRSKSMVEISSEIVKTHQLKISAAMLVSRHKGMADDQQPILLDIDL